jgi:hypothetical protein
VPRPGATPTPSSAPSERFVRLGVVALVLLAWFLRVWRLPLLPPGLHHDEAIEGLNALDVLAGHLRFWFPAGGGREPLFMYVAAAVIWVLGPTAFALRLLAAACATLVVPATFALVRRLFDNQVALVASGLLATSYWQVHTGRMGLRSALLVPLAGVAVALLLRGVDRARPLVGAAGGLALAAGVHVYFAGRLLPLVAFPIAIAQARLAWCRGDRRGAAAAVAFVAAGAVAMAPMALYVLLAPRSANERVGEASVFAQPDPPAALRQSVLGVLGMFFVRGDGMWKYNLDARPLFSPPLALLFVLGLTLCLARVRRRGGAITWLWLLVMSLASALATESPHFIRIGALAPVLFAPPALAAVWLWRSLPRAVGRLAPAALALLVAATAAATYRDYFVEWAASPQTGPAFAYDMADAAARLRELRPSEPVYLSVDPYEPRQLVVQFLAARVLAPGQLHWFDGRRELVLPPGPAVVLFPSSAKPPPGLLSGIEAEPIVHDDLVDGYRVGGAAFGSPVDHFGDAVELLRADPPAPVRADEPLVPRLAFRLRTKLADDLTLFGQIEGDGGGWGARDDRFYLTANREAGETIVAPFAVSLDPGAPGGDYRLRVGIYRRGGERLRLADGRDSLLFGPIHVEPAGRPWQGGPPPGSDRGGRVAPGLWLMGATADEREVRPGEAIAARTYWSRDGEAADCLATLSLRVGDVVLATRQAPVGGDRPPAAWAVGELVQQRLALVVPPNAPGSADADVTLDACGQGERTIGRVRLARVDRTFERPSPPSRLVATFDGGIRLIGHGIVGDWRPGGRLGVTLYWQALGPTDRPLTVFVHLLDAGEKVRSQRDSPPLNGARPTTGWQAGEYLTDRYELTVPSDAAPGDYAIEIGLYDPTTGARAPVVDEAGRPTGDRLILARGRVG